LRWTRRQAGSGRSRFLSAERRALGAGSSLLPLVSCALTEVRRMAGISQSATKDFLCFRLMVFVA
jgi:hypothetical protein